MCVSGYMRVYVHVHVWVYVRAVVHLYVCVCVSHAAHSSSYRVHKVSAVINDTHVHKHTPK